MSRRAKRILTSTLTAEGRGRLGDFRLAGRLLPVAAFIATTAGAYLLISPNLALALIKLWVAYSVAHIALGTLAWLRGADAPWTYIVPTATLGVALGGLGAAAIALAPQWDAFLQPAQVAPEWVTAVAFSAFFVGLSLITAEVRHRNEMAVETQRQLLEARLQTLTAQIEPHFLMNTLANLRYLIKTDPPTAARMLDHLADLLQGALERSRARMSTLGQELELVRSYLAIMQMRLGDRLRFGAEIDDTLRDIPFPPLLLHTLVENAVTHGVEPTGGVGEIVVSVRRDGPRIVLRVVDTGVGLDPSKNPSHGIGLRNTRERLATFYGSEASFALTGGATCGAIAEISIPVST